MKTAKVPFMLTALLLAMLACNLPGLSAATGDATPAPTHPVADPEDHAQPAGEPVLTIQPGSGYLFAGGQVVTGADQRDVWWNGVTLVPGQLIGSLGPLDDLSAVTQISVSAIKERELAPAVSEGYVMPTVDGQYVLLRMLSRGAQGEITVEWLYPFAGEIVP